MLRSSAIKASLLLVFATALSKILGLVRELIVARSFGASAEYDLYLVALTVPIALASVFRYILQSQVIPVFAGYRATQDESTAWRSIWKLGNMWFGISAILALIVVVLAPLLTNSLAPNLSPAALHEAVQLMQLLAPVIVLTCTGVFAESMLNAENRFAQSALAPLVYSLTIILCLLFVNVSVTAYILAFGVLLATIAQNIIYVVGIVDRRPTYTFSVRVPQIGSIARGAVLIAAIELIGQTFVIVDRVAANYFSFPEGSISALTYAQLVYELPFVIFAFSLGRVIFPMLSEYASSSDLKRVSSTLSDSLRTLVLIMMPLSAFLVIMAEPIVIMLFKRGAFDDTAVAMTAGSLSRLSLGLVAVSSFAIFMRVYYSMNLLVRLLGALFFTFLVKVVLVLLLARTLGLFGLATATAATWWVGLSVLTWDMHRVLGALDDKRLVRAMAITGTATLGVVVTCLGAQSLYALFLPPMSTSGIALVWSATVALVSSAVFIGIAVAMGSEEVRYLNSLWVRGWHSTRRVFTSL